MHILILLITQIQLNLNGHDLGTITLHEHDLASKTIYIKTLLPPDGIFSGCFE